jgi:hypothetical protein
MNKPRFMRSPFLFSQVFDSKRRKITHNDVRKDGAYCTVLCQPEQMNPAAEHKNGSKHPLFDEKTGFPLLF